MPGSGFGEARGACLVLLVGVGRDRHGRHAAGHGKGGGLPCVQDGGSRAVWEQRRGELDRLGGLARSVVAQQQPWVIEHDRDVTCG